MPNIEYCLHKYYFKQRQIQLKKLAQILFQTKTNTTEEKENCQLRFVLHADWRLHLEIKNDGLSAKRDLGKGVSIFHMYLFTNPQDILEQTDGVVL